MTIRQALGEIVSLPYIGNKAGSIRSIKDFENRVTGIMRNVGEVTERPNGANGYPSFLLNNIEYMIKTAKGKKPMWNESFVRTDSVLIVNLSFGTAIVHGSLITTRELEQRLMEAKDYTARHLRERYPHNNENFFISGGRTQFGDNINWEGSRIDFLHRTINILENN